MTTPARNGDRQASWHVRNWEALGWMETAVKGVGLVAAISGALIVGMDSISVSGVGYGVAVISGLVALGSMVQLTLRLEQREITSLAFAIANFLGSSALVWVVLTSPAAWWVPAAFGASYFVGEVIKLRFLATSGYTENEQSPEQMRRMSQGIAGLHLLLLVFAVVSG